MIDQKLETAEDIKNYIVQSLAAAMYQAWWCPWCGRLIRLDVFMGRPLPVSLECDECTNDMIKLDPRINKHISADERRLTKEEIVEYLL